ncbi:ImmA/IrrE family metallo-endopeptidase [Brevibacillus agri]|uniref:ImmA/IrrE family metallo-endopeptidase n=1 Tax=Brevibacillus agri TaxID=51101 RepID=UPI002E236019|nr:ImmA/IrrE family metallo-endopeptidase [Brevibacillus agri]MED1654457.1 ImmA/IrrE family metallo-endopeptidase [Brevibacillus agri]MED1688140.1 ImmA/IrrE family metallo-endopeptidase [Brevibacillus agri]MED1691130.1 ImmA/IrrE family metallo-endopeptidase [Brevibacillus agri]MED1699366.1 ImmA/IrrE family metallo-endopeptidase [Brevibacillus agri]
MARTDDIIRRLINAHGTNDPLKIAAQNKIMVLFEELGKNIWGYYACINRIPSIHINNRLDDFQTLFAIAHELGHHKMHPGINTPFLRKNTLFSIDKIEREANDFAMKLIIGNNKPECAETKQCFLLRCGIPEEFHVFY